MSRKLALKRLTASDLSFFEFYFRAHPDVKQKAINMDSQILVEKLYPSLPEAVESQSNKRVPLDMYLFGPGLRDAHNLQRKILKQQKNWRLNGELVHGPVDLPDRYNQLRPGDFALFEFSGTLIPTSTKMLLVAAQEPYDAALHKSFTAAFPIGSMFALATDQLEAIVNSSQIEDGHPILDWSDESLAEDAALGGAHSALRIIRRRRGRGMSPEDIQKSKAAAERIGVLGEELLNEYFTLLTEQQTLSSHEWVSSVDAIAPFDFRIVTVAGDTRIADAKSTSGGFQNPIHLSMGEIIVAVEGSEPYDIYRLYKVTEDSATLRIARDIGYFLRPVIESVRTLPRGVLIDSVSVDPSVLPFEPSEISLDFSTTT
jgi:hypothetical protein